MPQDLKDRNDQDGRSDTSAGATSRRVGAYQPPRKRVSLGSLGLDAITFDEAVTWTLDFIANHREGPPVRICSPNAAIVALAEEDDSFAEIVRTSNLVVADGAPLVWAASLLGTPLCGQIRGVDLVEAICAAGAPAGLSIYILGGLPGAAKIAAERLLALNPGLRIAGTDCPPIGFENDVEVSRQVRERIAAAAAQFLIVALGSPKQERWISANYRNLPVSIIQGVGAAIDTVAGLRKRPPAWMRNLGLEWFGRFLNEPVRLWRRYLVGNFRFIWIVFRQWLRSRTPRGHGSRGN
jgi:N-acetylglucosaminyldiphosphoundecaprenol N-acetyl-beta-D-mannosaminyltransferase